MALLRRKQAKPSVRLPIRRTVFGLRLFPDSLILVALFLGSLLLLYLSTRVEEPAPQAAQPVSGAESQSQPEPAPEVVTDISVSTPAKDAVFRSGDAIRGQALVYGGAVYYRVVESGGRVLVTGQVETADPSTKSAFEAKPIFSTTAQRGEIHVYGFSPGGGEAGKVVVPVRFR
jgi:hypothetical protein